MMQIRYLPTCQNFEAPNVARKQNSRGLRDTSSLVAALSKRNAHKKIQNYKFETSKVSREDRRHRDRRS